MPAYFYHIVIDLLGAQYSPTKSERDSSLSLANSFRDAFRPFQPSRAKSSKASARGNGKQAAKGLASNTNSPAGGQPSYSPAFASTHNTGPLLHFSDKRVDAISVQCFDMESSPQAAKRPHSAENDTQISVGIGTGVLGGLATRAHFVPDERGADTSQYGIVHLYRDAKPTSSLAYNGDDDPSFLKGSSLARRQNDAGSSVMENVDMPVSPEDCKVLCILAVPVYLSPSDFLGFVGEKTREQVSHFRMVKTSRPNRYMVLMKFRHAQHAKEWHKEWNGKVFNPMEPETCHVVFVKSIEVRMQITEENEDTPSEGASSKLSTNGKHNAHSTSFTAKPLAPPTPALVELPTCPVCLERMDETTGLLTIICQHVFHCTCLEKWKGSGCPVCRYTQANYVGQSQYSDEQEHAECSVCHTEANLWVCLICGNVGCGRYDEAHAMAHFDETGHSFAMDLASQRVWDYMGDGYVHRIVQNQADGKLVELPAADSSALEPPDWNDAVPREKLENMSVEYTHLLTSQLESQRAYFEEKVERAADKASEASAAAIAAHESTQKVMEQLTALQSKHDTLVQETVPALGREKDRAERRAEKFETVARNMQKQWQEEKTINTSLMQRIDHLTSEVAKLKTENEDLKEQNRDLTFFISGSEKLKDQGEDVVEGQVSIADPPKPGKKKGKRGKR